MYDASLIFYLGLRAQTCSTVDECYSWQAGVNAYFFSAATLGRRDDPRILAARERCLRLIKHCAWPDWGLESRRDSRGLFGTAFNAKSALPSALRRQNDAEYN